jgi:hypothetical protein
VPICARSTFGTERVPPGGRDPHLGDCHQLSAGPNLFGRERRQTVVYQTRNQACVEAVGAEQRLRHAVAARGREQGERAVLLGSRGVLESAWDGGPASSGLLAGTGREFGPGIDALGKDWLFGLLP